MTEVVQCFFYGIGFKVVYMRMDRQIREIGLVRVFGIGKEFRLDWISVFRGWLAFRGLDSDGGFQDKYAALTIQRLPMFNVFLHLFDYWGECFDVWYYFFDIWFFKITQIPRSNRI
jgi:hypothetical protein